MTTGERIKALRNEKGLTQRQLGDMCGMADSAIRRYESGRGNPTEKTLQKIALALGVSLSYLIDQRREIIPGRLWITEKDMPGSPDYQWTIEATDEEAYNFGVSLFEQAGVSLIEHSPIKRVIDAFLSLNETGQVKAVERMEELAEIPKYKKGPAPGNTQDGDGEDLIDTIEEV